MALSRHRKKIIFLALALFFVLAGQGMAEEEDEGAALFQFYCSTCHGDRGQGLTNAWRATWPTEKQNCWQSKCHALNHPPEGFEFPKVVPGVIGVDALRQFSSEEALYHYNRGAMPYWNPGMLSDEEYAAITTFLMRANCVEAEARHSRAPARGAQRLVGAAEGHAARDLCQAP